VTVVRAWGLWSNSEVRNESGASRDRRSNYESERCLGLVRRPGPAMLVEWVGVGKPFKMDLQDESKSVGN
jgi:hypothetical protein